MSEFSVSGNELKKLLNVSTDGALPFAYCPGAKVETDLFAMHRTKAAEVMAKALRAEGEGGKVAFGMLQLAGPDVTLTCEKVLPNLAKKVQKFLKFNKITKKVYIFDSEGNLLEEAADEDGDAAKEAAADDAPEDQAQSPEGQDAEADTAPSIQADVTQALTARAKALQPKIMATEGVTGEKLRQVFAIAVGQIRAQQPEAAGQSFDKIEQALAKLGGMVSQGQETKAQSSEDPAAAERQKKFMDAALQMAERIKALGGGPARTDLGTRLRAIVETIRSGVTDQTVMAALRQLQEDLKLAEAGGGATDNSAPPAAKSDPMTIWNSAKESTDAGITALQSALKGIPDPDLERIAEFGLNGVTEGNQVALMKHLFAFNQSSGEARLKAAAGLKAQCSEYRSFLAGSKLISLVDDNPFGVKLNLRATLGKALDDIDRAIAA